MNGEELREALRGEMASTTPPPPLSAHATLSTARRARTRRRTAWACAGSAAAVLAAAGVAALAPPGLGDYRPADFPPLAAAPPSSDDTARPWPTGPDGQPQEDRTARAGLKYERGAQLLSQLIAAVPSGYTAPENPANQPAGRMLLRTHQAQFEDKVNGVDVWSYLSSAAVAKGERIGRLLVEVHEAGSQFPTEPCALAREFWGMQGECEQVAVGAAQVGVVVRPGRDDRLDQWAGYRHPDGVVVFVAQGRTIGDDRPGLTVLPFSVPQLASLAVDERFHLK